MKTPSDTDPAAWQRHFAMAANNAAWALAEERAGPQSHAALLDAAHAAAWHWSAIGTELHRMRARMLLALAHAIAGHGATAMGYAQPVRDYFAGKADTPDWELAFAHAVHAHAAHAAGEVAAHAASYAAARVALDGIADAEDRAIVVKIFEKVPALA